MAVQTQKAKGILGLASFPPSIFTTEMVKQVRVYPHDPVQPFPFFARPCPMVPRHGFVESRIIETSDQWEELLAEVQKSEEPKAEVIMMPFIHCQFSGVLTESGISYGPGNDGVTGGKEARAIPAATSKSKLFDIFNLHQASVAAGISESPYLEFVESNGKLEGVQLRNGPSVPLSLTYVPQDMIVLEIVQPTELEEKHLLEWEKRMKELKGHAGVVIHFPGGSMHSHVAVQAIEQTKGTEHPFAVWLETEPPKVGEPLSAHNSVKPMSQDQLKELAAMLASSCTAMSIDKETDQKDAINLAIACLHAAPLWDGSRHLLVLRSMAIASMLRFAGAAVLGELRHWRSRGPGRYNNKRKTTPLDEKERLGQLSRDQVYERAFKLHISLLAPRMGTAYKDFRTKGWSGSFGGKNWANCTKQTILLYNGVSEFIAEPTLDRWQAVMSAWNGTVNVFHNTGKFLNKFISTSVMDMLAKAPVWGLTNAMVGHLSVHDEDFPLHRNPERISSQLRVTVPKKDKPAPEKPKAEVVAKPVVNVFEARFRMKSAATLYIQIRLSHAIIKEYGTAIDVTIPSNSMKKALHATKLDGQSLAGTGTPYGKGTVKQVADQWVLAVESTGLFVRIKNDVMESILSQVKASVNLAVEPDADDDDSDDDFNG